MTDVQKYKKKEKYKEKNKKYTSEQINILNFRILRNPKRLLHPEMSR